MRDASLDEFLSTDEGIEEPEGEAGEDGTDQSGSESEPEPDAGATPEPEGPGEAEPSPDPGEGTGTERDPDTASEPEGPPPVAAVEPARSTFAWSSDGAVCEGCGERVEERWESDSGLVCVECKRW